MTQIATPCQGGAKMTRIMELAKTTNGVLGDICQQDFGPSMAQMADQIATLSSRFFLNAKPIPETIGVRVGGVVVPQDAANGWTYDAAANAVVFHGNAIPPQGALIDIHFDPVAVNF